MSENGLDQLGLSVRTFRYLSAKGIRSVEQLLREDPTDLVLQASRWDEISDTLARLADRQPDQKPFVLAFLDRGWAAHKQQRESREQRRANDPEGGLPLLERAIAKALRERSHPMPLHVLRRQLAASFMGQTPKLREAIHSSNHFTAYPFGKHHWIGLAEWGAHGYEEAARAAWSVLPVHLDSLLSERPPHELEPQAIEAIIKVALERGDHSTMLLCRELLQEPSPVAPAAEPSKVRDPLPETPAALDGGGQGYPTVSELRLPTPMVAETPLTPAAETRLMRPEVPAGVRAAIDNFLAKTKPNIFEGLQIDRHPKEAVAAILAQAADLPRPFALAELRGNAQDYVWLKKWAREMPRYIARGHLDCTYHDIRLGQTRWSGAECFGALLLLLASEEARRNAQEGRLWDVVCAAFAPATRDELFTGGQPRAETRAALEQGARQLGVHHAFGREGRQSWYVTTFLQFGFTRSGVAALPVWLSSWEHTPEACLQLWEESESFQLLWSGLQDYRRKVIGEAQLRQVLRDSPFVLDDSVEPILQFIPRSLSASAAELDEPASAGLLGPARVRWQRGYPPLWEADFLPLDHLQLSEMVYEVEVAGQAVAQILLQSGEQDKTHLPTRPTVSFPLNTASVEIALLEEGGEDDQDFLYDIWDLSREITVFDAASGKRCPDSQVPSTRKSYILLLSQGLKTSPVASRTHDLENYGLHYLEAGWSAETVILDSNGESLQKLADDPEPVWLDRVQPSSVGKALRLESPIRLRIHGLPPDAVLAGARFGGQALDITKFAGFPEVTVHLPPSHPGPTVSLYLQVLYQGCNYRIRRSTEVELLDASVLLNGDWMRFDRLPPLCRSSLSKARCRFFLNHEEFPKPGQWSILEGDLVSQPPRAGAFPLPNFYGYGAPVTVKPGPFNRPAHLAMKLVSAVVNHGAVEGWSLEGDSWSIDLNRRIVPDEGHSVVFWDGTGTVASCSVREFGHDSGKRWFGRLPLPLRGQEQLTVALCYRGANMGTDWSDDFHPCLEMESRTVAGMLRWLRWPMLHEYWVHDSKALAWEAMEEVLPAWLCDTTVHGHPSLLMPEGQQGWYAAVREVYRGCKPSADRLSRTWHALLNSVPAPKAQPHEVLLKLLVLTVPALALRVLSEVLRGPELKVAIEGVLEGSELDSLAKEAARDMRVGDKAFPLGLCQRVANQKLSELDRVNLSLAYQSEAFSRLLVATYLQHLSRQRS